MSIASIAHDMCLRHWAADPVMCNHPLEIERYREAVGGAIFFPMVIVLAVVFYFVVTRFGAEE